MLKHPPFESSEYNCIANPEVVADFYLKCKSLEDRKADLELQKRELELKSQSSLLSVKEAVIVDVGEHLGEQDEQARQDKLGNLLPGLKTCLQRGRGIMDARRHSASLEILRLYARFDVEAFTKDVDYFVSEADDGKVLREELAKLNGHMGNLAAQIKAHWKNYEQCFKHAPDEPVSVPLQWRDWKVILPDVEGDDKEQAIRREKRTMAERIIRAFIRDWTDRAPMFDEPATVTGIAIHTLPRHKRSLWANAYEKLGLKSLAKRPYFKASNSHEKEKPGEDLAVHNPLFTKAGAVSA